MKKLCMIVFLAICFSSFGQSIRLDQFEKPGQLSGISVYHLTGDSIFGIPQDIHILELKASALKRYKMVIAWSDSALHTTSWFAEKAGAIAGLNGGFFNVEKGGSVSYLESMGKVIAHNRKPKEKWAKSDSLLNGAIILNRHDRLKIKRRRPESWYENSSGENSVLISGPLLLQKGKAVALENSDFVKRRHPRTLLCTRRNGDCLLIAVDGRSKTASGMNLAEAQQFLIRIRAFDAINLDGGGSTTLWINQSSFRGILNHPCDKEGERPVANVLLINPVNAIE